MWTEKYQHVEIMVLALHVPLFQQHIVMREGSWGEEKKHLFNNLQNRPSTLYIMSPLVSSDLVFFSASQLHHFLFFSFHTNCKSARLCRNSVCYSECSFGLSGNLKNVTAVAINISIATKGITHTHTLTLTYVYILFIYLFFASFLFNLFTHSGP